jgi:hypothetical protein
MEDRSSKINAAGSFLRAVGERPRAGAQAGTEGTAALQVARTLSVLADVAPAGSAGIETNALAAELEVSKASLTEALANLKALGLVSLVRDGVQEIVSLTDLGATVAEQQSADPGD